MEVESEFHRMASTLGGHRATYSHPRFVSSPCSDIKALVCLPNGIFMGPILWKSEHSGPSQPPESLGRPVSLQSMP